MTPVPNKLKVALVYLGRRGGVNKYSYELARELDPLVHLRCFLSSRNETRDEWLSSGVYTESFDVLKSRKSGEALWSLLSCRWRRLKEQLTLFDPDIIHFPIDHYWLGLLALPRNRSRIVLTVHDARRHCGESNLILQVLSDLSARLADRCITLTTAMQGQLAARGIDRSKIDVIPHGSLGTADPARRELRTAIKRVLFFGRIRKYKGLEILLQAFRQVEQNCPACELWIVGEGDLRPYRGLIAGLNQVRIRNEWLPDSEISHIFEQSDIVVLPYIDASQSGVLAIAAPMGIPVIASEVGGLAEQVRDVDGGILIPPHSPALLAKATVMLLNDDELRKRLGRNAQIGSKVAMSWAAIARSHLATYQASMERTAAVGLGSQRHSLDAS